MPGQLLTASLCSCDAKILSLPAAVICGSSLNLSVTPSRKVSNNINIMTPQGLYCICNSQDPRAGWRGWPGSRARSKDNCILKPRLEGDARDLGGEPATDPLDQRPDESDYIWVCALYIYYAWCVKVYPVSDIIELATFLRIVLI